MADFEIRVITDEEKSFQSTAQVGMYLLLKLKTVHFVKYAEGVAVYVDENHEGNIVPVYPTPKKIEFLQKQFVEDV